MRLFLLLVFASLLFQTSCTSKVKSDPNQIRIALESAPKTLDPRRATDANGQRLSNLLFQSFVRLGPDMKIIGDAAETWKLTEKSLKMKLKANLKFSNGEQITDEDLKFTFSEYTKKTSIFAGAYSEIKKVQVSGTNESGFDITLELSGPSATLLTDLSPLKILPKEHIEKHGLDFNKNILGSGPYLLEKSSSNEIILKKNPHSFEKIANSSLLFKIIKDDNTRYLKVLKGSIDLAPNVLSPQSSIKLLSNKDFQSFKNSGLAMNYLLVNLKNEFLSDINIRKAIGSAIDKESIIKYKLEGLASPASSILTPGNPFFHSGLEMPSFSLENAKKLFNSASSKPKELVIKTSNKPSAVENAKILANQIEKLGLKVKIQSYEWGTFFDDVKKGNYQLATMRWVGATDPDIYRIAFHSSEHPPGRNRGYYTNKELDNLLDSGTSIVSTEKRIKHYQKVQEAVAKDLPIIPLWYNSQVNIVNKKIEGFQVSKTGDFSYFKDLHRKTK